MGVDGLVHDVQATHGGEERDIEKACLQVAAEIGKGRDRGRLTADGYVPGGGASNGGERGERHKDCLKFSAKFRI